MSIFRNFSARSSMILLSGMIYSSVALGSHFIADMPELSATDHPNLQGWTKPGYMPGEYTGLMVVQPSIFLSEDNKYKGIQPDQLKAFADKVAVIFTAKLGQHIEIVNVPGPGVLIMNMAITELKMKKKRGIFGYTPIGAVAHAATSQTEYEDMNKIAEKINMTDATLEIELLDGASEERLAIRVLKVESKQKGREEKSWYALGAEIEDLADKLAANYDASLDGKD